MIEIIPNSSQLSQISAVLRTSKWKELILTRKGNRWTGKYYNHFMAKHTVVFKHDKETKEKQRYTSDINAPVSGSLYVDKALAGDTKEITVDVNLPDVAAAPAAAEAAPATAGA